MAHPEDFSCPPSHRAPSALLLLHARIHCQENVRCVRHATLPTFQYKLSSENVWCVRHVTLPTIQYKLSIVNFPCEPFVKNNLVPKQFLIGL